MKNHKTPWGTVKEAADGSVQVTGTESDTYDWAHRPGDVWPCSTLSGNTIWAAFDRHGDLVDIDGDRDDTDGHEFSAWASDVLGECLPEHPAR